MSVVIGVVTVSAVGCRQDTCHQDGAPGCGGDEAGSLVLVAAFVQEIQVEMLDSGCVVIRRISPQSVLGG